MADYDGKNGHEFYDTSCELHLIDDDIGYDCDNHEDNERNADLSDRASFHCFAVKPNRDPPTDQT